MRPDDLDILIQEGEGTTLEFKESLSSSFARELVAFANIIGGKSLIWGCVTTAPLSAYRTPTSCAPMSRKLPATATRLSESVRSRWVTCWPSHMKESDAKPVQCSESFFWRQNTVTQKLTRNEIRGFFRLEGVVRFDLSSSPRFNYPDDFDCGKFHKKLELSGITGDPPVEEVLVNIETVESADGTLLFRNAGALFFARNPRFFFSEAYITTDIISVAMIATARISHHKDQRHDQHDRVLVMGPPLGRD